MEYDDDDMLMLSGIQHYMFCPHQWALIHIEQQWDDNRLTAEGKVLHRNVDNPAYRQKNGDTITLHSVNVASHSLGLYGVCDAIELLPTDSSANSISHPRYPGYWRPYPIEYKRGHIKYDERDRVQVAAQVICLEEMYGINIPEAALFYNEVRRREVIAIDCSLRELTIKLAGEMHRLFSNGVIPKAVERPACRNCSLIDICIPALSKITAASQYLKRMLDEKTA